MIKVNLVVPLVTACAYLMIQVHDVVVLTASAIKKHGFREDGGTRNDELYTVLFVHHRYSLLCTVLVFDFSVCNDPCHATHHLLCCRVSHKVVCKNLCVRVACWQT